MKKQSTMKLHESAKEVLRLTEAANPNDILRIIKGNPNYQGVRPSRDQDGGLEGVFAEFIQDGEQVARVYVRVNPLGKIEFSVDKTDIKWSSRFKTGFKDPVSRTVKFDSVTDPGFIAAVKNPLSLVAGGSKHSYSGATILKVVSHEGGHGYESINVVLKLKDGSTVPAKIKLEPEEED